MKFLDKWVIFQFAMFNYHYRMVTLEFSGFVWNVICQSKVPSISLKNHLNAGKKYVTNKLILKKLEPRI